MPRRSSSLNITDSGISREIGEQYANVKKVADNIDDILAAGAALGQGYLLYDNLTAAFTESIPASTGFVTKGYYAPNDGGGGVYVFDPADTATADNRFTVIVDPKGGRWKLQPVNGEYNIKQSGAKTDGVTNNSSKHSAIVGSTLPLNLPEGDYLSSAALVAAGTLNVNGAGTWTKSPDGLVGPIYTFYGNYPISFTGVTFDLLPDATAVNTTSLFKWGSDKLVLDGVTANGGLDVDQLRLNDVRNTRSNIALVSSKATPTVGLKFKDSSFSNFFWGFLKSNTIVSNEKDISISFCDFDNMGATYLLFNSPAAGSSIENVQLIGNTLGSVNSKRSFGGTLGYPHRGSFAGYVEYTRLIGNHAHGYGGELFRAEEAAKASIWLGNTAKLNGKDGIEIIANNAGGTVHTPTLFVVADNVLENTGLVSSPTLGWGIGLHVYTTVSGLADAECIGESTVHDNISKGWDSALQVHQGGYRNLLHHNVLVDSAVGLRTYAPTLSLQDNLISDCPVAISFERGGIIGDVHFRSATGVPSAQAITTVSAAGSVTGWTWETGKISFLSGSNFFQLVELGSLIDAEVVVSVTTSSAYSIDIGRLVYDGTNLTFYRTSRKVLDGVILSTNSPFGIKNGNLAIQVFNGTGGTISDSTISVALRGLHTWS